jgi:hypothetical protein
MTIRRSTAIAAVVVLVSLVPAAPQAQFGREPAGRLEFENGRDARGIPFQLNSDKIYLQTVVNSQGPFWLVLDTGSPGMILDTAAARRLGLETGEPWRAGGAGEDPFMLASVRERVDVSLPGVRMLNQNAVAGPIDRVVGPFEGRRIDGVLGCHNVFADFVVEIDYAGGTISIIAPEDFEIADDEVKILPVRLEDGVAIFEGTLVPMSGEAVTGRFVLDTGLRGTGVLTSPFVKTHRLEERCGPTVVATTGGGIGGQVRTRLGRISRLQAGDLLLHDLYIGMYQGSSGVLASEDIAGIFGSAILQRFRPVFDYPRGRVALYPAPFDADRLDMDKSGMFLVSGEMDRSVVTVIDVIEGSPAGEAGLERGDVIALVDGAPAGALGLEEIRRAFRRKDGTVINLVVERDGQRREARLTLRRVI